MRPFRFATVLPRPAGGHGGSVDTVGSDYPAGVIVVTGEPGAFVPVSCGPVSASFATSVGTAYSILVFGDAADVNGGQLRLIVSPTLPPPDVNVTVDGTGSIDPATGAAVVQGTLWCSTSPESVGLTVSVLEKGLDDRRFFGAWTGLRRRPDRPVDARGGSRGRAVHPAPSDGDRRGFGLWPRRLLVGRGQRLGPPATRRLRARPAGAGARRRRCPFRRPVHGPAAVHLSCLVVRDRSRRDGRFGRR